MIFKSLDAIKIDIISSYDFTNPETKQRIAGTQASIRNPNPTSVNNVNFKLNLHPDLVNKLNLLDDKEKVKFYDRPVFLTTDDQPSQSGFRKSIINIEFTQQK